MVRTAGRIWVLGQAGTTHCGAWLPVQPGGEYGWTTRLVCVREPGHRGKHRTRDDWTWR